MKMILSGAIVTIIGFLISLVLIPVIIKLSHRNKWYDLPDHRKIHTGLIPRLGGVGFFVSFILSSCAVSAILFFMKQPVETIFSLKYLPVFSAFLIIHLLGLIDDFFSLKAIIKLLVQIIAASIIVFFGFSIKSLTLPYLGTFSLGVLGYPITIFWIISITNAVNLVDGMDGLAGGIGAFSALAMGVIALINGNAGVAIICFALFGSVAGFLLFNLPPAKIFMGDSGSLFLGFSLSVLPLLGLPKAASFGTLIIPITLLIIPIIDVLAAIFRRVKEKRGIMSPDRAHIHHKLLDMGFSEKKILVLIYSVCFYLGVIAVTSVIMPKESNVYVILVVWIGSMMGYGLINYMNSKKLFVPSKANNSTGLDSQNSA